MKYIHKSKDWLIENYQLAIIMIVVLFFICNSLFTSNDDNEAIIHQQDTTNEVKQKSSEEKDVDNNSRVLFREAQGEGTDEEDAAGWWVEERLWPEMRTRTQ